MEDEARGELPVLRRQVDAHTGAREEWREELPVEPALDDLALENVAVYLAASAARGDGCWSFLSPSVLTSFPTSVFVPYCNGRVQMRTIFFIVRKVQVGFMPRLRESRSGAVADTGAPGNLNRH